MQQAWLWTVWTGHGLVRAVGLRTIIAASAEREHTAAALVVGTRGTNAEAAATRHTRRAPRRPMAFCKKWTLFPWLEQEIWPGGAAFP